MFTKHNLPCVSSVLHQRVNINYERSAGKESKSPLNVDPAKSSILILLQIYLLHCAFVARKKKNTAPSYASSCLGISFHLRSRSTHPRLRALTKKQISKAFKYEAIYKNRKKRCFMREKGKHTDRVSVGVPTRDS